MHNSENMLQVKALRKSFDGFMAVSNAELEVRKGEIVAVIGPNGAGKTTLFSLIAGQVKPDSGKIVFKDRNIFGLPPYKICRQGISRSFQVVNIFNRLTVFENVQVAVLSYQKKIFNLFSPAKNMAVAETEEILADVGLGDKSNMISGMLSHGDQKVLEMAVALGNRPELLILDEPTAGMSHEETAVAIELIKRLSGETGLTILFCEHDMGLVFSIADRIMVMQQGKTIIQGKPEEVRNNEQVQEAYLGGADEKVTHSAKDHNMDMLKKYYGIENAVLKKLEGYDSINYQVSTYKGQQYVWKQYPYTPETYALLRAENRLLLELSSQPSFSFPVPLKGLNGKFIYCSDNENEKQLHRLLTYVKGKYFAEVEHTPELFVSFGHFLACMNKKILNFRNAEIEARQLHWDIQHLPLNRKFLKYIQEPEKKKLIDYFFLQFRETVVPKIYDLRKSIIHSDANDWNVIVNNGKVTGIIDFGDIVYSPLINEIAIAITYAILSKPDPIKWAGHIIKGYHDILPLEPGELNLLYYLIGARLCISVCNSAQAKQKNPDSEYITISEKPAWNMLEKWISLNPIQAGADFSKAAGLTVTSYSNLNADLAKRRKYISKGVSTSYPQPVKMVKAAFQYMYDSAGKTYLDAYNNIPHVGHCHPKVVEAGQKQMACLNTNTRYLYDQLNYYAERLAGKFPDLLNKIYFVNSGSAACDLAIRLALTHTGFKDIMVVEHGYHGNTHTGIEISSYKFESKGGQASHIVKAPIPDIFRGKYQGSNAGEQFAQEAVNLLRQRSGNTAAFICEPIIGCGGQIPLPDGYLKALYPAIRESGGVCISDEVQTGFGRLGKWFWGFRMQDVVPDIVVLGKPMGNGHPIAAVVTTDEISRSFENGMEFFSSFGGNSVSCAIGLAVLDVIEEEGLQQHALETGSYLKKRLKELKQRHSVIGDVRGQGLFLGIEFVKDTETLEPDTSFAGFAKNRLKENGILTGTDGPYDNVLKIKPPICFNKNNADQLVSEIEKLLG